MKKATRIEVHNKYDGKCAYCGTEIEYKDMQVDHMLPKCQRDKYDSRQISHIDNLMPSCRTCNHYKRSADLEVFRVIMSTLHGRVEQIYINRVAERYGIISIQPFSGVFYFETLHP